MAKQYYATNEIRHGLDAGDVKVFAPGDLVTGLSKDQMVSLWNAGALTEVDPDEAQKAEKAQADRIAELEAELAAMRIAEAERQAALEGAGPAEDEASTTEAAADSTEEPQPVPGSEPAPAE